MVFILIVILFRLDEFEVVVGEVLGIVFVFVLLIRILDIGIFKYLDVIYKSVVELCYYCSSFIFFFL